MRVEFSKLAEKQLLKIPVHVVQKLDTWIEKVEKDGLLSARYISGYHDEPLKGSRKGQRSIRLNRAYRAIYELDEKVRLQIVVIVEVNKHDY
jgi:toxin HigB-1